MAAHACRDGRRLAGDRVLDGNGLMRGDPELRQRVFIDLTIRLFPPHILLAGDHGEIGHVDMIRQRRTDYRNCLRGGCGDEADTQAGGTGHGKGVGDAGPRGDAARQTRGEHVLLGLVDAPDHLF